MFPHGSKGKEVEGREGKDVIEIDESERWDRRGCWRCVTRFLGPRSLSLFLHFVVGFAFKGLSFLFLFLFLSFSIKIIMLLDWELFRCFGVSLFRCLLVGRRGKEGREGKGKA